MRRVVAPRPRRNRHWEQCPFVFEGDLGICPALHCVYRGSKRHFNCVGIQQLIAANVNILHHSSLFSDAKA